MAVQYYWTSLLACRILPRECSRTFLIHPKCQLSFKKQHLLRNTDWFQNRWIPCGVLLVELLICISMHVEMGLTYSFIRTFFYLSVSIFFLSFISIYYILSLFASSCLFFLISFFFLPFMLQLLFVHFLQISFVILCRLLFVTYFLLLVFIFFLFSSIYLFIFIYLLIRSFCLLTLCFYLTLLTFSSLPIT